MWKQAIIGVVGTLSMANAALAAQCDHITISAAPDYPPYQWLDGQDFKGASIALIQKFFEREGVDVRFTSLGPLSRVLKLAQDSRLDLILSVEKTTALEEHLKFTQTPMFPHVVSVFINKDDSFLFRDWSDLEGRYGGKILGHRVGMGFDEYASDNLAIEAVTDGEMNMRKLLAGRIDYYIDAYYPGLAHIYFEKLEDTIQPATLPLVQGGLYAAFSMGSPCYMYQDALSAYFEQEIDQGRAESLLRDGLLDWLEQNQDHLMGNGQEESAVE